MAHLHPHIQKVITLLKHPALLVTTSLFALVLLIGIGVAVLDYQTNFIATRLGKFLVVTNRLRPQVGNIWQRIEAQTRTQENIDQYETLSLNDIQKGLANPIRQNRFESEVIPNTNTPSYVAIWTTPTPNTNINDRPLHDIISSRRIYQRGLAVIKALTLPDLHFHHQIQTRVEQIYAQFEDPNAVAIDTLVIVEGDTLETLAPDSLKASVFNELATEMIPTLKEKEKNALLKSYQEGHITQLFLYRDLGRYRGELYRDQAPDTPVPFTISTNAVAQIFQFSQPDTAISASN